ncbi:hypothetical protein SteCoe_10516 [Stentor coeruleus]|uniref:Uncharacterized protein n=1 Tax=Stentor coeruleus TaxID=5963 RepID=A0A1R2CFH3_9CILI|nr:hypothetical protein SteCoe_10516 [Stentor coeruleus]
MQKAMKQRTHETSLKHIQRQSIITLRTGESKSALGNTDKIVSANSHFQYHQKLKYPDIPSFPAYNDFGFKPLIRKSYFKCYEKESLSPIKSVRQKPTFTDNEFKEISQLIKLINTHKLN